MIGQFVAGDWGTSNLRLFLCAQDGTVLEASSGPGAAQVQGQHAAVLENLLEPWQRGGTPLPVILSGMVGSTIGWLPVPYVSCPARPEQIARACTPLWEGRVHIIPGLSCRNPFDAPDLMRGEETQILGSLSLEPRLQRGRHLLALPGTHTKWVMLENGTVAEFLTAPTGELYALLREHSVLVGKQDAPEAAQRQKGFQKGLMEYNRFPKAQLLHRLFECRSRTLCSEIEPPLAAAFLSGLLIASDVHGALATLRRPAANEVVTLIGAPELTALYATALAKRSCAARQIDGAAAALAGLIDVKRQLSRRIAVYAS